MEQSLYQRTRTRLWGEYGFNADVSMRLQLTNEFFDNVEGKPDGAPSRSQRFPSEIIPDNVYMDINHLLGGNLDLRIGRQDLFYGTGKIILDGTPEDGSRTSYFNGIKAAYRMDNDVSVDLFGVMNRYDDDLAINNRHWIISPNKIDESAIGLYLKNNHKQYPSELYYVYKHENDVSAANNDVNLHTFGARLMPNFTDALSGNLEVAFQTGDMKNNAITDIGGWLVDAKLAYKLPVAPSFKPVVDVSYYYLSGDDQNSRSKYEGWWQVFGRWSQDRELYVYSSIGVNASPRNAPGWWTNLSAPSVGLNLAVAEKGRLDMRGAWLMANVDDGAGTGKNRGLYFTSIYDHQFTEKLSGQVIFEFLNPGNYYLDSTRDAHFTQFQAIYKF
ncbi:MAG: alginate export family protein [Magnetococcales bacterium]|nr:alginate export family protein [Magnetococcales bacterium]